MSYSVVPYHILLFHVIFCCPMAIFYCSSVTICCSSVIFDSQQGRWPETTMLPKYLINGLLAKNLFMGSRQYQRIPRDGHFPGPGIVSGNLYSAVEPHKWVVWGRFFPAKHFVWLFINVLQVSQKWSSVWRTLSRALRISPSSPGRWILSDFQLLLSSSAAWLRLLWQRAETERKRETVRNMSARIRLSAGTHVRQGRQAVDVCGAQIINQ